MLLHKMSADPLVGYMNLHLGYVAVSACVAGRRDQLLESLEPDALPGGTAASVW